MVSLNEASLDLREISPLSRNSCIAGTGRPGYTGQRTSQKIYGISTDYRGWLTIVTSPKVPAGHLIYPASVRDTAKSGMSCTTVKVQRIRSGTEEVEREAGIE